MFFVSVSHLIQLVRIWSYRGHGSALMSNKIVLLVGLAAFDFNSKSFLDFPIVGIEKNFAVE